MAPSGVTASHSECPGQISENNSEMKSTRKSYPQLKLFNRIKLLNIKPVNFDIRFMFLRLTQVYFSFEFCKKNSLLRFWDNRNLVTRPYICNDKKLVSRLFASSRLERLDVKFFHERNGVFSSLF